jgi:hypothetical protein
MSKSWLIAGIVGEKPKIGDWGEYNGEDVYHPNQPKRGQIDECLVQFSGKAILVIAIDPTGCCGSVEELAQEVKDSVAWMFENYNKDNPIVKVLEEFKNE